MSANETVAINQRKAADNTGVDAMGDEKADVSLVEPEKSIVESGVATVATEFFYVWLSLKPWERTRKRSRYQVTRADALQRGLEVIEDTKTVRLLPVDVDSRPWKAYQ